MTDEDIKKQIGEACLERKRCMDEISCYEQRFKNALYGLQALLDKDKNPHHEDNQRLLNLDSDPREDAKGYIAALNRAEELTNFLKTHNAI